VIIRGAGGFPYDNAGSKPFYGKYTYAEANAIVPPTGWGTGLADLLRSAVRGRIYKFF
jgi:hypothetical protein